jgi:hypothetical protein
MTKEFINEIEELINYAVKEGYLDEEMAEQMSLEDKKNYYLRCWYY